MSDRLTKSLNVNRPADSTLNYKLRLCSCDLAVHFQREITNPERFELSSLIVGRKEVLSARETRLVYRNYAEMDVHVYI